MSALKILHTADWHIGSFPGPEIGGENARFLDVMEQLNQLTQRAVQEDPDIILVSGDIFHQAKVWSDRGLKEQSLCISVLRDMSQIAPVVVMRGTPNHDSEEQFKTLSAVFTDNDRVHIVTRPGIDFYTCKNGQFIQIACLPGFDKEIFENKNTGSDTDSHFYTQELARIITDLSGQVNPRAASILMAHYTIAGANMESGQTALFSDVDPVITKDSLQNSAFTLHCFGHIHRPQEIPGARAFYSGALMQMNFNDEGQQRGFYIHEVEPGKPAVSRFVELPCRQYQTLMLTDPQIASFIDKKLDLSQYPGLTGKIVRIRYSCTDANNKLFNHMEAQSQLKAAGAFYVSEISPIKITMSLAGLAMDADNTPESNLEDYFLQRGMDKQDVYRLVSLAKPILDTLTANTQANGHHGLFLPVEISVKNYRNYVQETFSFENIQFCTINGDNGVGKSSLFMDAVCDALYEEPREGDLTGWIRNDPKAKTGMIQFTFAIGDELFRVTRKRAKSGKINLDLEKQDEHGVWQNLSCARVKDTQERIQELIGMDSLTFRACALIMQDQYGLFLEADKEARMDILGNILGLGVYDDLEQTVASEIVKLNREARDLQTQENTLLAGTDELAVIAGSKQRLLDQSKDAKVLLNSLRVESAKLTSQEQTKMAAQRRVEQTQKWMTERLSDRQTQQDLLTKQEQQLADANALLACLDEIQAGVAEYERANQVFVSMQAEHAANQVKVQRLDAVRKDLKSCEQDEISRKRRVSDAEKAVEVLTAELAREDDLTRSHEEFWTVSAQAEQAQTDWDNCRKELSEVQGEIRNSQKLRFEKQQAVSKLEQDTASLKKRIALMDDCNCLDIEKAQCSFLADAKAAQKQLPETEYLLSVAKDELTAAQAAEKSGEDKLSELEQKEAVCSAQVKAFVEKLDVLGRDEKDYQALLGKKSQMSSLQAAVQQAQQDLTSVYDRMKGLTDELHELEQTVADMSSFDEAFKKQQAVVSKLADWLDMRDKLKLADQTKQQTEPVIASLKVKLADMDATLVSMREEIQTASQEAAGLANIQHDLQDLNSRIDNQDKLVQTIAMQVGQLDEKTASIEKRVKEAEDLRNKRIELKKTVADYETLKQAFSTDGIRHNIIRSIIPILEATATSIVAQMSRGTMSVEFKTEKTLKSNKNKEVTTLDIIVHDTITGSLPYASRSGGEKVKVSLSVILALAEIRSRKSGVSLGFLFIDEPPFLDGVGAQAYCDALVAVQSRYQGLKIMAITHDISMKSRFPQSVEVVKTAQGSHVIRT